MRFWQKISIASWEDIFGIDLRSLATFRMGVALFLLFDLFYRATALTAHYTDEGVFPRSLFFNFDLDITLVSLHLANGTVYWQIFLFAVAGIAAFFLLIGYRTSLFTLVSWFMLVSVHARNPLILQGGDILIVVLLFWGIFLPWGAYFSVDSALNSCPEKPLKRVISAGSVALLLQVAIVYLTSVVFKLQGTDWPSGMAVYYALSIDHFTRWFGFILLDYPRLMRFLTYAVLTIESAGALMLFNPFWTGRLKTALVFIFIGMHIGFFSALSIGFFPWISIVSVIPFLPSWFWDKLRQLVFMGQRQEVIVYFDEECGFCKKMISLLRTFALIPRLMVLPAQSSKFIESEMREHNSWVVADGSGGYVYGWNAFTSLLRQSPLWCILGYIFSAPIVRNVGELLYVWIANNRTLLTRFTSFPAYRPISLHLSRLTQTVVVLFFFYIFFWNIGNFYKTRPEVRWVGHMFHFEQRWTMFAPGILRLGGWFIAAGTLDDGNKVSLFPESGPLIWAKPASVSKTYPTDRWRNYVIKLLAPGASKYREYFARYLCRQSNIFSLGEDKARLREVELIYMLEEALPDYTRRLPQKYTILHYSCDSEKVLSIEELWDS